MKRGQPSSPWAGLSLVTGIGVTLIVSLLVGLYLGKWLDRHLGTDPLFTVLGLVAGVGAGSVSVYRQVLAVEKQNQGNGDG